MCDFGYFQISHYRREEQMTAYIGGKCSIGKEIAQVIMHHDPQGPGQSPYWEPFVGMCGVMRHMEAPLRVGSDLHYELICMWQELQKGWIPPETITEKNTKK